MLTFIMYTLQLLQLQPFNGLFSRTTWVSGYQKGKTNLDFTEARDSEWQWHQLGRMQIMQVCTSIQRDNHASTPHHSVFYRPDALPAAQPTASMHQGCRGDGISIPIPIPYPQKILWVSPQDAHTHSAPKSYIPIPAPCLFTTRGLF